MSRIVCWLSCGAASAAATKLALQHFAGQEIVIARCIVREEHPDNNRFAAELRRLREHSSHTSALLRQALAEVKALHTAIRKLHSAKGRYHTQLAACDLFDLVVGLPNERPKK